MKKLLAATVCAVVLGAAPYVHAAIATNPVEGVFKGIYADTITVQVQSDMDRSADVNSQPIGNVSFQVNSNTGYRNFNQLTDLKEGDMVKVDYNPQNNVKDKKWVAFVITKLEPQGPTVTTTTSTTTIE